MDLTIATLDLKSNPAPVGAIVTSLSAGTFSSMVNATGGGISPTSSYVYARFTRTGITQLAITDVAALASLDWDIAFRRSIIRLNGGDSGPSCVAAVAIPSGTNLSTVTSVSTGANWVSDSVFSPAPACSFTPDGSGLGTLPLTAVSSWYSYTGCVAMTGQVFVVRARDGGQIALTIDSYYEPATSQTTCNQTGTAGTASGGTIRFRWRYVN